MYVRMHTTTYTHVQLGYTCIYNIISAKCYNMIYCSLGFIAQAYTLTIIVIIVIFSKAIIDIEP